MDLYINRQATSALSVQINSISIRDQIIYSATCACITLKENATIPY